METDNRQREGLLRRCLPIAGWLPFYKREWLASDIFAGLTVWALLISEAPAYAGIAGVTVQYGLYAAPIAILAYAIFGSSRQLFVGPSSEPAVVSAAVVATPATKREARPPWF